MFFLFPSTVARSGEDARGSVDGLSKGVASGGATVAAASNSSDGCASSLSQQLNMAAVAAAAASASSASSGASTALFCQRQQQRFCESNLGVGSGESYLTGAGGGVGSSSSDWELKRGAGGNKDEHGHYL